MEASIEAMQGATLECLEILATMRRWMQSQPELMVHLPLLVHMAEVALDGAPVGLQFERFFGAPNPA